MEIRLADNAILAPAAVGIHRVLKVDDDFEAVVLKALDRLPRHAKIFFGRGFEGFRHIEQP